MAKGINRVILIGNLGKDPETRATASGLAVTHITIATSESWKDKNTGQFTERTEWHRVVFFNNLAEIVSQYLKKGSKVYIEGALRTRKWKDQSGADKYTTEIIATEMQMIDSRNANTLGNEANIDATKNSVRATTSPKSSWDRPPPINPNLEPDDSIPWESD